jgi:hypothetical protein
VERAPIPRSARGAALPLALILLAVLTVIAVAAVSLSGQERVNARSYGRIDFIHECANAAQAKIWAELAYQGSAYLSAPTAVTHILLPDGTKLTSPAHYDQPAGTTLVKDVVVKVQSSSGTGGDVNERDCTNSACGMTPLGGTQMIMAHCVDQQGRALEIELGIRFAL